MMMGASHPTGEIADVHGFPQEREERKSPTCAAAAERGPANSALVKAQYGGRIRTGFLRRARASRSRSHHPRCTVVYARRAAAPGALPG